MLKFIFGRTMCGKTETVFRQIKEDAQNNKGVLLIVPEQSTFDCERKLLHMLGDGGFTSVPVLSFTRLCDEVGRLCGGICSKRLTDCDRLIFMNRAVSSVSDRLTYFGKYASNLRFTEGVLATADEFRRCGMGGDDVRAFSRSVAGSLSAKLCDVALIMDTYEGLLENKYSDPSDDLTNLNKKLGEYAYFAEKKVYIDSFKNFTGAQLKILERIIEQADEVIFSFCFDQNISAETELFGNVGATVDKLCEIAKKHGVEVEKPCVLDKNYYTSPELAALESGLSVDVNAEFLDECKGVVICRAPDMYCEAEFAAREIRRLVREEGYRYRDFVIMSRHDEQYRAAVEYMCRRYEVPCFTDKRYSVLYLPLSVMLLSAMQAINGFASENIFKYLKTELTSLTPDEVSLLENYVYVWKINGKKWFEDWDMSPSGFEKFDDNDKQQLALINELRARAVAPLIGFKNSFSGTAGDLSHAVWKLMESQKVGERLAILSAQLDSDEAELTRQGYNAVIEILDSLSTSLGDNITEKEYCEYFSLALSGVTVGTIPQMLDEVTFGAADRIRPHEPKVCFLLGINQGVFPSVATVSGIIAGSERIKLLRAGMPILDYTLGFSVDEEYLLYTSACCASDKVYFCYSTADGREPSAIIDKVKRILPKIEIKNYEQLSPADRIETAASAFSVIAKECKKSDSLGLWDFFSKTAPYAERLETIKRQNELSEVSLSPENSERLFGKDMYLSATGIDTYFRCAFSYFCRYGLNAKVLKPAEIDNLQRGTIVHDALEKIVSAAGEGLKDMSDSEIESVVVEAVDGFLSKIQGVEQITDNRFLYAVSAIKSLTADVIKHIRDDFRQNGFVPVKCELKLGGADADIEGVRINTEGGSIKLRGAIDRVDRFGAYIRVVDYKTGTRKFRLPDVLYGLNMQMLLYLYAVINSGSFSGAKPAGVLYLETRKTPDSDSNFRMNGIMVEDKTVHDAMDIENEGHFVPKLRVKKDGNFYKSNDFVPEENFYDIFSYMEGLLRSMNVALRDGKIPVNPTDGLDKDACKYCDYSAICGIENRPHRKVLKIDTDNLWRAFKGGELNV